MRVWDVSPRILCRAHLLGEHREIHAVHAVISRGSAGYSRHPETLRWMGKLPALAARHARLADEMRARGYRHASPMRAGRGTVRQRSLLLSRAEQIARLEAKPCSCPLPLTRMENRKATVENTPLAIEQLLTRLTEQPRTIASRTAGLPRYRLHRAPKPGEWSVNDVLAHLRSCSDVWGKYMTAILDEDRPTIRAVNPTTWINSTDYPALDFATSFRRFTRQRARLLTLLRPLPTEAWSRRATVTGAGAARERTLLEYAQRLADHERSHVKHIARLLGG